ncbi:MAG: hypothetical protein JWM14_196 [Chitinophagaceae bacterium]|nr:hypothetical protein [Chitinophagaceae bacterium]
MKKVFWSIVSGGMLFFISILTSLLLTPYILKQLTREEYAFFYLINSLVVWFGILRMGQNGGFRYQLALSFHRKKFISSLYSTLIVSYTILSIVIMIIGLLSYRYVGEWLGAGDFNGEDLWWLYLMLLLNFSITGITFLFSNILSVYNKEFLVNSIRIVLLVLQALFTVMLLNYNYKLVALGLPLLVTSILLFLTTVFLVIKIPNRPLFSVRLVSLKTLYNSLAIGKWFLLGFLSQLFIKHTDVLLIGKLVDLNTVTAFLLSAKLYFIAMGVLEMALKTLNPHLLKLHKKDPKQYSQRVIIFVKLFASASCLLGYTIFVVNEKFIAAWVGPGYFLGTGINFILLLSFIFTTFNAALKTIVLSKIIIKQLKLQEIIEGVFNLILSILLGSLYGVAGVVLATILASMWLMFSFLFSKFKLCLYLEDQTYIMKQLKKIFFFALLCLSAIFLSKQFFADSFWMELSIVNLMLLVFAYLNYHEIRQIIRILTTSHNETSTNYP